MVVETWVCPYSWLLEDIQWIVFSSKHSRVQYCILTGKSLLSCDVQVAGIDKMRITRTSTRVLAAYALSFIIMILFFQEAIIRLVNNEAVQFIDEIVIAVLIVLISGATIARGRAPRTLILGLIVYMCFVLLSVVFGQNTSVKNVILQSFIHLKFLWLFIIATWFYSSPRSRDVLASTIYILILLSIFGVVINYFLGISFYEFFSVPYQERWMGLRIQGLQLKPNDLALFIGVLVIFLCYWLSSIRDKKMLIGGWLFVVFAAGLLILTGSRIGLISIPFGLALYAVLCRSVSSVFVLATTFSVLLLLVIMLIPELGADVISRSLKNIAEFSSIEESRYIRALMVYYGGYLAIENFPIGTGAATFGTVLSGGSSVYSQVGLANTIFVEEMTGIYDSNLGSILGEFGFLGVFGFYIILRSIYKDFVWRFSDRLGIKIYAKCIISYVLIASIVNPMFMSTFGGLVLFLGLFSVVLVSRHPMYLGQCVGNKMCES